MTNLNELFSTMRLGQLTLKNRVEVALMTRTSATSEGLATDQMASYYASIARGSLGLIIVEGTYTDELYSHCYFNQPGLANSEQAQSWVKVVVLFIRQVQRLLYNWNMQEPYLKGTALLSKSNR
ncbi:oxidoreductase [Paenibacillus ottowii]